MMRGALIEYAIGIPPLVLVFDFNPETITRTRSIKVKSSRVPGNRGYDFALPTETPRVSQGVSTEPETMSIKILLDATGSINKDDPISQTLGVEPELDTLRAMVEPKAQGPGGVQMMASLGLGQTRAFQRNHSASVLLFIWGTHILPVFLTKVHVTEKAHLATLIPYRAEVTLDMTIIEGMNPFYLVEQVRTLVGAAVNTGRTAAEAVLGLVGGLG